MLPPVLFCCALPLLCAAPAVLLYLGTDLALWVLRPTRPAAGQNFTH